MTSVSEFEDIRPYQDDEVPAAMRALVEDNEFLFAIKSIRLGWLPNWLFPLFRPWLKHRLKRYMSRFNGVRDFQLSIESYIDRNIETTSDGLDVQGEDSLRADTSYLFISNHRDIVMDPAYCNIAVHRAGRDTCRIAIGDNLLSKPFVERLMRANKSFIVKRATGGGREWLKRSESVV